MSPWPGKPLFLEIFSGDGGLTAAVREKGLQAGPGIDVIKGQAFDILNKGVQQRILQWIREKRIWCVWLGTPCSVWCIARKGIKDVKKAEGKDRLGVIFAMFSAKVIEECIANNVAFALENPMTSKLFHFPPIRRALASPYVQWVKFHACAYGAKSMKPTMFAGTLPGLQSLVRKCPGISSEHKHDPLSGSVKAVFHGKMQWNCKTIFAGAYAKDLCTAIGRIVATEARARGIPLSDEPTNIMEQEATLLGELEKEAENRQELDPIPQEHLEFASRFWRKTLVKKGLLKEDAVVHGQFAGPLSQSVLN